MSLVYWDSMLFVYQFDGHPKFGPKVARILDRMEVRGDRLCTSAFAVAEVLAGPRRAGDEKAYDRMREFFRSPELQVLEFRLGTAERFAEIQGRLEVSSADAVHLACAAEAGVDLFLTADRSLLGKVVPGIDFIADLSTDIL